jgi:hypothetical protein
LFALLIMENTSFFIDISIQGQEGPKRFARFELGADRKAALGLFKKLKGSPEISKKDMLYIEFMETANGLPVNLDVLTCNLQELGMNSMLITQEVFRLSNLKAG